LDAKEVIDLFREEKTMKGTVKFFNEGKGFGFIAGEDGKDFFVHKSSVEEGVTLQENDKVTFDIEQGDRGPKAGNVKKE
jgi:cold shock protein